MRRVSKASTYTLRFNVANSPFSPPPVRFRTCSDTYSWHCDIAVIGDHAKKPPTLLWGATATCLFTTPNGDVLVIFLVVMAGPKGFVFWLPKLRFTTELCDFWVARRHEVLPRDMVNMVGNKNDGEERCTPWSAEKFSEIMIRPSTIISVFQSVKHLFLHLSIELAELQSEIESE